MAGYVCAGELAGRSLGACMRPLAGQQTLEMDALLSDVIQVLTRFDYCFVTLFGEVVAVIGRGDIEKPVITSYSIHYTKLYDLNFGVGIFAGSIFPGSNRLVVTGFSPCWQGYYISTMGGSYNFV